MMRSVHRAPLLRSPGPGCESFAEAPAPPALSPEPGCESATLRPQSFAEAPAPPAAGSALPVKRIADVLHAPLRLPLKSRSQQPEVKPNDQPRAPPDHDHEEIQKRKIAHATPPKGAKHQNR